MATQEKSIPPAPPPSSFLIQLATGHFISNALFVAAKLGIADALKDGPRTANEIATLSHAHVESLARVLRLLASVGVFSELEDGRFALTPVGECLQSSAMRSSVLLLTGELVQRSWGDLLHSVLTGEPAIQHVFGMDSFAYFEKHAEEGTQFDAAMSGFTSQMAGAVSRAYDFSGMEVIVDIGGGNGTLLSGILKAHPNSAAWSLTYLA